MPLDPQQETNYLLAKIRNYLVVRLRVGAIQIPEAAEIAQTTLDLFPDGLTMEQFTLAAKQLEQKFPNHYATFHASQLEYKLTEARKSLDQDVLADIAAGNLDSALDKLNKFDLK